MNNDEIIEKGDEISDAMMEECEASEGSTLEDEYCSDEGMCQRHWKEFQEWLINQGRADEKEFYLNDYTNTVVKAAVEETKIRLFKELDKITTLNPDSFPSVSDGYIDRDKYLSLKKREGVGP